MFFLIYLEIACNYIVVKPTIGFPPIVPTTHHLYISLEFLKIKAHDFYAV